MGTILLFGFRQPLCGKLDCCLSKSQRDNLPGSLAAGSGARSLHSPAAATILLIDFIAGLKTRSTIIEGSHGATIAIKPRAFTLFPNYLFGPRFTFRQPGRPRAKRIRSHCRPARVGVGGWRSSHPRRAARLRSADQFAFWPFRQHRIRRAPLACLVWPGAGGAAIFLARSAR